MEHDFFNIYLEGMRDITPLDKDEMNYVLEGTARGDMGICSRLVEGCLREVLEMVREYGDNELPLSDLIQEVNTVLMLTAIDYDGNEPWDELTTRHVKEGVELALEEQRAESQIEGAMTTRVNMLQTVSQALAEELGRETTLKELSARVKMTEDEVRDIMKLVLNALTINGERQAATSDRDEEGRLNPVRNGWNLEEGPQGIERRRQEQMKLYIIHHRQTGWSVKGKIQNRQNVPLSAADRSQAGVLAKGVEKRPVTAIYSSPQIRTMEMAEIPARAQRVTVIPVPKLVEIGYGDWEGGTVSDILVKERKLCEEWWQHPATVVPLNGEALNWADVGRRKAWERTKGEMRGDTVVVAYGGTLTHLIVHPPEGQPDAAETLVGNTSITTIEYDPVTGQCNLVGLNDRNHLI